jgi:hypothetical protein
MRFALAALFAVPLAAHAQEAVPHYHIGGGVYTSPINCDWLKGQKAVCLVNQSEFSIESIKCSGALFSGQGSLPGGTLAPGAIAIVTFNSGTCAKKMEITWSNHDTKTFTGEDIKDMTVWTLKGPRDAKHGGQGVAD